VNPDRVKKFMIDRAEAPNAPVKVTSLEIYAMTATEDDLKPRRTAM